MWTSVKSLQHLINVIMTLNEIKLFKDVLYIKKDIIMKENKTTFFFLLSL